MGNLLDISELFEPNTTVITNNNRLAKYLLDTQALMPQKSSVWQAAEIFSYTSWLQILWHNIIHITDCPILLRPVMEMHIWSKIIKSWCESNNVLLINERKTAKDAAKCWKLLNDYAIINLDDNTYIDRIIYNIISEKHPDFSEEFDFTEDNKAFFSWAQSFIDICRENNWLSQASLAGKLLSRIKEHKEKPENFPWFALPKKVIAASFNDPITPQQAQLFNALIEHKCPVIKGDFAKRSGRFSIIGKLDLVGGVKKITSPYKTFEEECRAAALWAYENITKNPHGNFAIATPNLKETAPTISRILDNILCPKSLLPNHKHTERPYNIYNAERLIDYPQVKHAMLFIQWAFQSMAPDKASSLIISPYIKGYFEEFSQRGQLDFKRRENPQAKVTIEDVLQLIVNLNNKDSKDNIDNIDNKKFCSILSLILSKLKNAIKTVKSSEDLEKIANDDSNLDESELENESEIDSYDSSLDLLEEKRTYTQWAACFNYILNKVLLWPGNAAKDSFTYQVCDKFMETLEELGKIDILSESGYLHDFDSIVTVKEAWRELEYILNETPFQPKTNNVPLQVIGFMETQGLSFDAMWVIGCDENSWPVPSAPETYLPNKFQIALDMLKSSPGNALRYSKAITNRVKFSAEQGYVSFAESRLKGSNLEPVQISPLAEHLGKTMCIPNLDFNKYPDLCQHIYLESKDKNVTEQIPDEDPLPRSNSFFSNRTFGSSILKNQAICPFKAFATDRLKIKELKKQAENVDPILKGNLVHQCLETVWQKVRVFRDENNLKYDSLALKQIIENGLMKQIIADSMTYCSEEILEQSKSIEKVFLELEISREIELLNKWFDLEQHRTPQFNIDLCEKSVYLTVGKNEKALKFSLRIDRADVLENGEKIVIDYKTGKNEITNWVSKGTDPERLIEPQMPLYVQNQKAYGAAYASLKNFKDMELKGVADTEAVCKWPDERGSKNKISLLEPKDSLKKALDKHNINNWDELKQYWSMSLEKLALDFINSKADIDPVSNNICQASYCPLKDLCRYKPEEKLEDDELQEDSL